MFFIPKTGNNFWQKVYDIEKDRVSIDMKPKLLALDFTVELFFLNGNLWKAILHFWYFLITFRCSISAQNKSIRICIFDNHDTWEYILKKGNTIELLCNNIKNKLRRENGRIVVFCYTIITRDSRQGLPRSPFVGSIWRTTKSSKLKLKVKPFDHMIWFK